MGTAPHTAQECHSPLATSCLYWDQAESCKGLLDGLAPLVFYASSWGRLELCL